ncbi:MAG: replication-associated recombination protein A [Lachnospiraceae bacterium]|nr:replication-associated recombination protein A [Lachnospiraceae bacterium]
MDLFEYMNEQAKEKEAPLALRMRPRSLEEIVGQEHILSQDKLLYRAIRADRLSSLIFYGPPGTGKTTLASVIAATTKAAFCQINATTSGKKEMETVVEEAKRLRAAYGRRTILFIDEIHRFNKAQQDYLLPFVEDGTVVLIGATTENPYFEVNKALLSRSNIFELKPLGRGDVLKLIHRAVEDKERGMGIYGGVITDEAAAFLADMAGGDARRALNAVELGLLTTEPSADGKIHLTLAVAEECIQKRSIRYDKGGDGHYDVISAFIKSMRGSDPDAAVYYLARMIRAGEDPRFIARRIMICAAEDVGMADPRALLVAVAAAETVERVGMPEGRIPLAEAAVYIATAPKSNASYMALERAASAVENVEVETVPLHLMNIHAMSAGEGEKPAYRYAHDFPGHYVKQQYLPNEVKDARFFEPGDNGYEKDIKRYLDWLKTLE